MTSKTLIISVKLLVIHYMMSQMNLW